MTDASSIAALVFKHLTGELTAAEQEALNSWVAASPANREWFARISDEEALRKLVLSFRTQEREQSEARVLSRLQKDLFETPVTAPIHRIHLLKTAWFKYAAAILIIAGIGTYLWNTQKERPSETVHNTKPVPAKNDVAAPASTKAVLTLAGGEKIEIDNAAAGSLAEQGSTQIIKDAQGAITYHGDVQPKNTAVVYNTLTVPRGSRIAQLALADGTQVWLNSESSVTYPVAFTEGKRTVTITGEAYFEVARDARHPFVVQTRTDTISVLGTHFNVNAYADEAAVTTTLLEGKVRVQGTGSRKAYTRVLLPGQANANGQVRKVKTEQAVAWKNGEFQFDRADLAAVLRQLSRWYDIEIVYTASGKAQTKTFSGDIKRNLSLADLLEGLKSTGLKFTIDNKKLIIQ